MDQDIRTDNPAWTANERTIRHRKRAKEKLKEIIKPDDNVDDVLESLERFCTIILESL